MSARRVSRPGGASVLAYGDTNLFVALLAGPAHPLHGRSLDLFRRVAGGELSLIVTPVVVAELVYVASATIGWDRAQVAEHLGSLLDADGILLADEPTVVRALALYGTTSGLDFADAYLAAAALEVGPPVVASFDSDFDRVAGVRRIAA